MDFYHRAALILDSLDAKKGSVKGLCMAEAKRGKFQKAGEASRFLKVIIEVLKYRPHLLHLLKTSDILKLEPKLFVAPVWADNSSAKPSKSKKPFSANEALKTLKHAKKQRPIPTPENLATVMIHDLVFAKRGLTLPKEHKVRKKLEDYKPQMDKETERERKRKKVSSNEGLQISLPEQVASSVEGIGKGKKREMEEVEDEENRGGGGNVRWLRVNTLKWTVEAAVEWFENERWEMVDDLDALLDAEKVKVFCLDAHIEPLLAVPISVSLPSLQPYLDSRLVAQDKASCMPAWVLLSQFLADQEEDPEEEEEKKRSKKNLVRILDATAAPGNKTTMAAALVGDKGTVVAVERDMGRFKVLKEMCRKAGARNVTTMNLDFLSIDPQDEKFKNISHFLVDPSCSGSGIPSRLDHLLPEAPEEESQQRIRALSNFQLTILSHAMRFRGARRVVYSTCSIWGMEDEGVVARVLAKKEFQEKGWRLATKDEVMPNWERRGKAEECGDRPEIAPSVVRALPEDQTNGFFVACFIRDAPEGDEENESFAAEEGTISHADRQEAFRSKARAPGGKGGQKGKVKVASAPVVEKPKKVEGVKKDKAPTREEKVEKAGMSSKKAKYLAEKARRKQEGK
ncbi:S-adenosyl-L-methionine-dependent methyltransferase [Meredithblackwellia eburnea MCA 4105]